MKKNMVTKMKLKQLTLDTFNQGVETRSNAAEIKAYAVAIRKGATAMGVSYPAFNMMLLRDAEMIELKNGDWLLERKPKIFKI